MSSTASPEIADLVAGFATWSRRALHPHCEAGWLRQPPTDLLAAAQEGGWLDTKFWRAAHRPGPERRAILAWLAEVGGVSLAVGWTLLQAGLAHAAGRPTTAALALPLLRGEGAERWAGSGVAAEPWPHVVVAPAADTATWRLGGGTVTLAGETVVERPHGLEELVHRRGETSVAPLEAAGGWSLLIGGLVALAAGAARWAASTAERYARERTRGDGGSLLDLPAVQALVGRARAGAETLAALLDGLAERDDPLVLLAVWSEAAPLAIAAVEAALQTHGGYGYMDEYGLSKRVRDLHQLLVLLGGPGGWRRLVGIRP